MPYDYLSPERATQKNGHEMNIRTPNFVWAALSGLVNIIHLYSQGVALGWYSPRLWRSHRGLHHGDIKRRGGNPFMERTVPEAIIRLKQGFGRLIRTKSDTGTVAILDHRVLTAAYGRYFLRALPACATEMIQLDRYAGEE
jgi:hypothetical protein